MTAHVHGLRGEVQRYIQLHDRVVVLASELAALNARLQFGLTHEDMLLEVDVGLARALWSAIAKQRDAQLEALRALVQP